MSEWLVLIQWEVRCPRRWFGSPSVSLACWVIVTSTSGTGYWLLAIGETPLPLMISHQPIGKKIRGNQAPFIKRNTIRNPTSIFLVNTKSGQSSGDIVDLVRSYTCIPQLRKHDLRSDLNNMSFSEVTHVRIYLTSD